jgi:hypothetical protein
MPPSAQPGKANYMVNEVETVVRRVGVVARV